MKLLALLSLILSVGCHNNDGKVEIFLISKEVHSLDKEYDGNRYTENEKQKAKNMLTFKLINNTDKKQLLFIDPYSMLLGDLSVKIKDSIGKEYRLYPSITDYAPSEEYDRHQECVMKQYEENLKKYEGRGIKNIPDYMQYNEHSVILYPGEERTFRSVVYLPWLSADNGPFAGGHLRFDNLKAGDSFQLVYHANVKRYKDALPDWELKELKERGVNFYADTIDSNVIPLRLKTTINHHQ